MKLWFMRPILRTVWAGRCWLIASQDASIRALRWSWAIARTLKVTWNVLWKTGSGAD